MGLKAKLTGSKQKAILRSKVREGTFDKLRVSGEKYRRFFELESDAAIRDITVRTRAEEAMRERERRMAQVIEFLPDAAFVIDMQGKVTAWNRAMESH